VRVADAVGRKRDQAGWSPGGQVRHDRGMVAASLQAEPVRVALDSAALKDLAARLRGCARPG
jgi:hypothetical protein